MNRRLLLMAVALAAVLGLTAELPRAQDGATRVTAVEAVGMTVSDMDRSVDFYARVLAFERLAAALRERKLAFVSPGVVALPDRALGFSTGLSVRDPDGHVMRLVQP